MSDSGQEIKVYMVGEFKSGRTDRIDWWYPQPFARRESAVAWAIKSGMKEGSFRVDGFRVRG